jgi:hypothetical protein
VVERQSVVERVETTPALGGRVARDGRAGLADLADLAVAGADTLVRVGTVERLGPATVAKIREWLSVTGCTIQPVLRTDRADAVDGHQPPPWMRELVILRDPRCLPFGCPFVRSGRERRTASRPNWSAAWSGRRG